MCQCTNFFTTQASARSKPEIIFLFFKCSIIRRSSSTSDAEELLLNEIKYQPLEAIETYRKITCHIFIMPQNRLLQIIFNYRSIGSRYYEKTEEAMEGPVLVMN
jgi:hypothetical protein